MSTGETSGPIHPDTTENGKRYLFHIKHHGQGGPAASQWLPTLSSGEEFAIFATADSQDFFDARGNLYGVRARLEGRIPDLGTDGQQIAAYPVARDNEPWHGYPLWPLRGRNDQARRPPGDVFLKMERADFLTTRERKVLQRARHT